MTRDELKEKRVRARIRMQRKRIRCKRVFTVEPGDAPNVEIHVCRDCNSRFRTEFPAGTRMDMFKRTMCRGFCPICTRKERDRLFPYPSEEN